MEIGRQSRQKGKRVGDEGVREARGAGREVGCGAGGRLCLKGALKICLGDSRGTMF